LEQNFVRELDAGWQEIARQRETLVREVFSEQPDPARIEAARARIAEVQMQQQQRVIAQFLQEREILNAKQRQELVDLLLREEPVAPRERQLHGGK
ncbi:MAG: periplasmic heavy metal sensor, partial [Burkholderiaceae bacterium]|nr:periplasmic heavy metal sensor [Burkholderiaceae bacterium]